MLNPFSFEAPKKPSKTTQVALNNVKHRQKKGKQAILDHWGLALEAPRT